MFFIVYIIMKYMTLSSMKELDTIDKVTKYILTYPILNLKQILTVSLPISNYIQISNKTFLSFSSKCLFRRGHIMLCICPSLNLRRKLMISCIHAVYINIIAIFVTRPYRYGQNVYMIFIRII